jgi:DNA ligase 1
MSFKNLCQVLERANQTTKKNEKVTICENLFDTNDVENNILTCKLLTYQLEESYKINTAILNVGDAMLIQATHQLTGTKPKKQNVFASLTNYFNGNANENTTSLQEIRDLFLIISQTSSREERANQIIEMWNILNINEIDIFNQLLLGKLRVGLQVDTIIVALGNVYNVPKEKSQQMYRECISFEKIISFMTYFGENNYESENFSYVTAGIPFKPQLAKPLKDIEDLKLELNLYSYEYKFDGERIQVHILLKENNEISVHFFSRNGKNDFDKYRDLVQSIKDQQDLFRSFATSSSTAFIFDGEIIPVSEDGSRILSFRDLANRKRKRKKTEQYVHEDECHIQIRLFDMIMNDNDSIIHQTLEERRLQMNPFQIIEGFEITEVLYLNNDDEIMNAMQSAMTAGCEGLIVKENVMYKCDSRTAGFFKLKKDYVQGLMFDSLDLIVVGAKYGSGKRENVWGSFLLATKNPNNENEYVTICNIGTGFTEEMLENLNNLLTDFTEECPSNIVQPRHGIHQPDVYFETPTIVFEVQAADITKPAEEDMEHSSGYSLRFPRFLRIRDDKTIDEASPLSFVNEMYESNKNLK